MTDPSQGPAAGIDWSHLGPETWKQPEPVSLHESLHSVGTVSCPLLAGFALTAMFSVASVSSKADRPFARWPDATLTLLVASVAALVMAMQCSLWARAHMATPTLLREWADLPDGPVPNPLRNYQRGLLVISRRWLRFTRASYHLGIVALLLALTLSLFPAGDISGGRGVAISVAALGCAAEVAWIASSPLRRIAQAVVRRSR